MSLLDGILIADLHECYSPSFFTPSEVHWPFQVPACLQNARVQHALAQILHLALGVCVDNGSPLQAVEEEGCAAQ